MSGNIKEVSQKTIILITAIVILSLSYLIMLIGLGMDDSHDYFVPYISVLYFATGILLLYFHKGWSPSFLLFLLIILVAGFLIQFVAVKTGLVYGPIRYGTTLGPKLLGVPVIATLNEFVILYCMGFFVKRLKIKQVFIASLLGALIILLINILVEPVALFLKFYSWSEHMFVFHNFGARFLISFAFLYLFNSMKFPKKNDIYLYVLLMEILFFMVINFIII
jgi:bisanhydrobacterioruberin hydratase